MQGRALLNAIGNLELSGAYAEALRNLGLNLEDVARQVRLLSASCTVFNNYFLLCRSPHGEFNQNSYSNSTSLVETCHPEIS